MYLDTLPRVSPCHGPLAWQYVNPSFSSGDGGERRQGNPVKTYERAYTECLQHTTSEDGAEELCSNGRGDGLTYQEFSVSRDAHTLE